MLSKKNLLFIIFCIAFAILFAWLGIWQLQRLAWKQELIDDYETKKSLPVSDFSLSISNDKDYWSNRNVLVNGTAFPAQEFRLTGKPKARKKGGHIILPIKTADNIVVFAMLGWAPLEWKDKNTLPFPVSVSGRFAEYSGPKFSFLPNNMPEKDFWLWADVNAFAKKLSGDIKEFEPFPLVLKVDKAFYEDGTPEPLAQDFGFRNDHLGYAITWLSLAIITIVMTIYYVRNNK
jgi:surfeit locus 1 family protein